jgi:Na+/proline symporter
MPAWVAGLAFLSANLGAQEVIGMAASRAKYGIATSHFYWLGAIPAMVFVGIFMMPFYYGSKARSVPDYLSLRFDEKTRGLNALTFACMTIMSSGISMYAMALLIESLHIFDTPFRLLHLPESWVFHVSIVLSALIVLAYIFLGGLTSAIYNEVLQFFLIVAGFAPLVFLGLRSVGGWSGLKANLPPEFIGPTTSTNPTSAKDKATSITCTWRSWRLFLASSCRSGPPILRPLSITLWTFCSWCAFIINLATRPRPNNELQGLVYALTEKQRDRSGAYYTRPVPVGLIVLGLTLILNIIFF